ncbi:thioredoxin-like protein YneN [Sporomusaceae bacterium FL31]|nr:thioredoxin-like protein YneN [Sporomusaceae bacterium FL31]GCE32420.1 thioredoxin-like protein YneN [Sporomusaceae bacterium]
MKTKLVMGVLVGIAILALVMLNADKQVEQNTGTGVTVGKKAPEFTLNTLDGQAKTIGKQPTVTVINFWATWCPPCREEMPELNQFYQGYKQAIAFYAINIQESPAKVNDYIHTNQLVFPVLLDRDGGIAKIFQINAIPTTVVIDKHGIIQYRKAGTVTKSELEAVLNKI